MGHYTSYTKHCELEDWYCYNDETATKSKPGLEEYCNAYILFYKKQGNCYVIIYHNIRVPILMTEIILKYIIFVIYYCFFNSNFTM